MELTIVEKLLPVVVFIFVSTITPGPNNLMLAASGMQFGYRLTLPHILGIHLGLYTLILMAYVGLNQLLLNLPGVLLFLRLFGSAYLLYLAWKMFGLTLIANNPSHTKPLTILQAGAFQFANPKAWIMTTSAMALAIPLLGSASNAAFALCLTWASIGFVCNTIWVLGGVNLNRYLSNATTRRIICVALALLTVATVAMFWIT
jgi:threonine/homoserine/homoserine lactone efflux protein